jgi:DNA polymerase III delta prime subunit
MARDSQDQRVGDIDGQGDVQIALGGRDVINAQNSQVTKNAYYSLFGHRGAEANVDWDRAMQILRQEMLPEIKKRLKDSLFGWAEVDAVEVRTVRLEDSPSLALEAVKLLTVDGGEGEEIDPRMPIIQTYAREDVQGKLLILGTPGAGKTITLLKLAEQLVGEAIAQPQTVIPIIFELSTWKDGQRIEDWLIEQLYENYGGNRKQKIYETWLERRLLLPLLDGLDELGMVRQKACTEKVNEFAKTHPYLVVCCRVKEFQQAGVKLSNLRGAVQLEPLSDRQIQNYLGQVGKLGLWEQIQTAPEMWRLLEPVVPHYDETGLLRVPLFLRWAAEIYCPERPLTNKAELLERYVKHHLDLDTRDAERSQKGLKNRDWVFTEIQWEPSQIDVQHSLHWLAKQLKRRRQVDFLIEKMDSSWLSSKQKQQWYRIIFSLIFGLLISPINDFFLSTGQFPLTSLIGASVIGYIGFSQDRIEPVERFSLKRSAIPRAIMGAILFYLIITMLAIPIRGIAPGLITSTLFGLPLGILGSASMLCRQELKIRLEPNQGMWESVKKGIILAIFYYPIAVFGIIGMSLESTYKLGDLFLKSASPIEILLAIKIEFLKSIFAGVGATLLVAIFIGGGKACLQHISLRLLLTFNDRVIPWNLARCLTYCHERRLLQQIGGRYRFIHRELLDHFAAMPDRPTN